MATDTLPRVQNASSTAAARQQERQAAKDAMLRLEALLEGIKAMNPGSNEALLADIAFREVNTVAMLLDDPPAPATCGADIGASVARIGAVLAAAGQLATDLEDGASPEAFAKVTALQSVVAEGRAQVRAAEQALVGGAG